MGAATALINALNDLVNSLGPDRALLLLIILLGTGTVIRFYERWRAHRDFQRAQEASEKALQRAADEARDWRILILMKEGMSAEEIERLIIKNQWLNDGIDKNDVSSE